MDTCFVTTSIPYVNARPHIGFALELVLADVIARWHQQKGFDTFLLTGTDENAAKNARIASQLGMSPQELCDQNSAAFRNLHLALNVPVDNFIRTSSRSHKKGVWDFWLSCDALDIYSKHYTGLYCHGCEDFYLANDLVNGHCPIHNLEAEVVDEENFFFRLSNYQEQLETVLASDVLKIHPEARRNEALSFIRLGLKDFSISRSDVRYGDWGIPTPINPSQIVYVWFDALINYLTGLGYGSDANNMRFWSKTSRKVHVIGKDILRFHGINWPAMLLSANLNLPTDVVVHGFLTVEGRKISKSNNNAIDPIPLVERYGSDAVRYYLLRTTSLGADGDFSEERLKKIYNSDLADNIGNTVRRIETLCERSDFRNRKTAQITRVEGMDSLADSFQFNLCLQLTQQCVRSINQEIESVRPWDLLKQQQIRELHGHLSRWIARFRTIGLSLQAFLPKTAEKIISRFSSDRVSRGDYLFPKV